MSKHLKNSEDFKKECMKFSNDIDGLIEKHGDNPRFLILDIGNLFDYSIGLFNFVFSGDDYESSYLYTDGILEI